jgi:hypothetical protein
MCCHPPPRPGPPGPVPGRASIDLTAALTVEVLRPGRKAVPGASVATGQRRRGGGARLSREAVR